MFNSTNKFTYLVVFRTKLYWIKYEKQHDSFPKIYRYALFNLRPNDSTFNTMFKTLSNFGTKPCEMHEEKTTWLISKRIYRYARPPRINHHFSPSTVNFSSKNNYRTNNKFCRYFLCSQQVIYAKFFSYHPTILAIDSQWLLIVSIRLFLDLFRHFGIVQIIEMPLLFLVVL